MTAPTVGLTGGIATGKSTVAQFFAAKGIRIVDADEVARAVVAQGTPGLAAIVEAFGEAVLHADGSLDREQLGTLVFGDDAARNTLNAITHPRIAMESRQQLAEAAAEGGPYVMYEAALLVENGLARAFAALVVVSIKAETQLARLMDRNGFGNDEATARIASQAPLEDKVALADYVIENDGVLSQTEARVDEVHAALLKRFASRA